MPSFRKLLFLPLLASLLFLILAGSALAGELNISPGKPLPDLEFPSLLLGDDYAKLGLPIGGEVNISKIPGEYLIIEFFNKSCVPCQRQVREMEKYYQQLIGEGKEERFRILAVAVGNKAKYLPKYRKKRGLTYAIAADPVFEQWRRLGDPGRTPFIVFLRREGAEWILNSYKIGVHTRDELALHSTMMVEGHTGGDSRVEVSSGRRHMKMPLTPEEVKALAVKLITKAAGQKVKVESITLKGEGRVFRGRDPKTGRWIYARATTRAPVCEVCHAVHFMYIFDDSGRILAFEPIHVTKLGNVEWNEKDIKHFAGRLRGQKMATLDFNPNVDAVSAATMSSALIFDEIRRTMPLLEKVKEAKESLPGTAEAVPELDLGFKVFKLDASNIKPRTTL